jgi:hypothetical protein
MADFIVIGHIVKGQIIMSGNRLAGANKIVYY